MPTRAAVAPCGSARQAKAISWKRVALQALSVGSDSEARLFGEVPVRATVSDRLARRLLLRQIESAGVPGQLLASW